MESPDKISEKQILDALKRSGYLLESRLIKVIAENGYFVYPNEVYKDKFTGKPREVDIYASSKPRIDRVTGNDKIGLIQTNHCLVIECVNNPQPVVFFKKNIRNTTTCYNKYKYFSSKIGDKEADIELESEYNECAVTGRAIHYDNFERSTQYCSFTPKKGAKAEWMASHSNDFYETFVKLFDFTLDSFKQSCTAMTEPLRVFYHRMFYPVVVLQGEMYDVFETVDGEIQLNAIDNKVFEFNYYDEEPQTILIDIVVESQFDTYLKRISNGSEIIRDLFVDHFKPK